MGLFKIIKQKLCKHEFEIKSDEPKSYGVAGVVFWQKERECNKCGKIEFKVHDKTLEETKKIMVNEH